MRYTGAAVIAEGMFPKARSAADAAAGSFSRERGRMRSEQIYTAAHALPKQSYKRREIMNIRQFLGRHFEISNAISSKLEQLEELRHLAASASSPTLYESHCTGTYSDRVGRTVARIMDLDREINEEIDRLVEIKIQIRNMIDALSDSTQRTILERHYILHESWEVIAEKIGYSPRHITRLHNQAVAELEKAYGDMAG